MLIKAFYLVTLSLAFCDCGLLRTPKVYNALITTNENLSPSRAFPVIQPVIQPIFNPIYPGSFFDPYQQYQYQQVQPAQSNGQEEAERKFNNQPRPESDESKSPQQESLEKPQSNEIPQTPPKTAQDKPDAPSPIPLNEFGLPPSLVPLRKYQPNNYPYNVPFVYDTYGNYQGVQQYPVLPPFSYFGQQPTGEHQLPPIEQPMFQVGRRIDQQPEQQPEPQVPQAPINNQQAPEPLEQRPQPPQQSSLLSESIKNNANKNINIPDVEAPPIPFSIKP